MIPIGTSAMFCARVIFERNQRVIVIFDKINFDWELCVEITSVSLFTSVEWNIYVHYTLRINMLHEVFIHKNAIENSKKNPLHTSS